MNDRQVKLSRGKFLGGCSGCNGTLCVRGTKQDYDDWGLQGWSGDEFFKYMSQVSRGLCKVNRMWIRLDQVLAYD